MKRNALGICLSSILVLALNSCVLPPAPLPGPTPQPNPVPYEESKPLSQREANLWHETGSDLGLSDGEQNLGSDWGRHGRKLTDRRYQADFIAGYTEGYAEGKRRTDLQASREVAWEQTYYRGYDLGREDRNNGRSRKPSRYEAQGHSAVYSRGYEDGWNGAPRDYR